MKVNQDILDQATRLIQAIKALEVILKHYSKDKPGPTYISTTLDQEVTPRPIQLNRAIFCKALAEQIQEYETALAGLGFER